MSQNSAPSRERHKNAIKSLTTLYTVVIGVALTRAVLEVIEVERGLASITLPTALLFIAFVATLFPFFHGALRHLDDAYVENDTAHIRDGALVIDFVLLFVHALAFVALALLLKKPGHFAWVLVVLLSIDVIWGVFAVFASASRTPFSAETKWTVINLVFISCVISFLVWNDIGIADLVNPLAVAVPLACICILRSIFDYLWCKSFYFPKD